MNTTFLVGAMTVAVAVPIGYTITRGHQEKIRLIQTQITQEEATQQAQADVAAMLRQIEQYRTRLPSEPNPSWLVAEAVALGERAGLQLTAIAHQESPHAVQQFTRLAVTVEFNASYHQLGTFLDLVERSERFLRVERMEIRSPTSKEKGNQGSVELTLSTLYLPPVLKGSGG